MSTNVAFTGADFFVLRTPLLPFDTLLTWSAGLAAPQAEPTQLEDALAADRARLRADLCTKLAEPVLQEAIFVASPDLYASLARWLADPDSEKGQRVERALVRYFQRMAGRATPFGLFSGCSVGTIINHQSSVSNLTLAPGSSYQRHTRLDMDYLFALTETLNRDPAIQRTLCYRPNSSLYWAAGRLRYAEARLTGKVRTYHLVAVEETEYLNATLVRAQHGATLDDLAAALVADDPEITLAEAEAYISEVSASQLLVSTLAPAVTGPEPIHGLIDQLRHHPQTAPVADHLIETRAALVTIDAAGLGIAPAHYQTIAEQLAALPVPVALSRLFQVDMVKPAPQATLAKSVLDEIHRGVDVLHRIASPRPDALARFRAKFSERYEGQEVPLVEALDEEIGIGFDSATSADHSPLLDGLVFPSAAVESTTAWGGREQWLLRKLEAAWRTGAQTLELTANDLAAFENKQPLPLPNSFAVTAMLAAGSEGALAQGDFRILLEGMSGPSGARLLGRFCHGDPALHQHVEQYLAAEEALEPDALFAEIVHLPEGRIGNVLCRPRLRQYEIPYLGHAGGAPQHQIPITDLLVSIVDGKIVLRSQHLGRRVFPRLTTAHNYIDRSLGIYKFLGSLQNQGVAGGLKWDWGALADADFLPRVTHGRLVLARARWRIGQEEIHSLAKTNCVERYRTVQGWRIERRLPRFVLLVEHDNLLPIDFDNILSLEAFVDELKGRPEATLVEMFPGPGELCAHGPEGHFVHEIVVPFVRQVDQVEQTEKANLAQPFTQSPGHPVTPSPRRFAPGSEWLYVKLYTGTATADQLLSEVIRPAVQEILETGVADHWFFIRYSDPDWHLRLRFHGDPVRLHAEGLPRLQAACAPWLADGRIWRVQLDTYEREVERYGGGAGIDLAERLFHADSEAVLGIIELLAGDAGADARWRLTFAGMDMLMNDLGFDLPAKQAVIRRARDAFLREFHPNGHLKGQLGEKHRNERKQLQAALAAAPGGDHPLAPGLALLRKRTERLAPIVSALRSAEQARRLTLPLSEIAWSYLHMHANRLLRSNQRAHELVLYDLLERHYQSLSARQRQG